METQPNQNSKNLKVLLILLFLLLVATGALSIWQYNEYKKINKSLETTQEELLGTQTEKDELNLMLQDYEERLNQLEAERTALAEYSVNLEDEVSSLKSTIAKLKKQVAQANPAEMQRLRKEISDLGNKTLAYEQQIESLMEENEELRNRAEELREENTSLSLINKKLDNTVQIASEPQFGPIKIETGRMRRKGFSEETKVRRIEEIRFYIDVIENPVVTQGNTEEIKIRIIDPEKRVIAKLEDNKELVDKSEIYTIQHHFEFDGKPKNIMLKFEPETSLIKGTYQVEFWAGNKIKQTTSFELN